MKLTCGHNTRCTGRRPQGAGQQALPGDRFLLFEGSVRAGTQAYTSKQHIKMFMVFFNKMSGLAFLINVLFRMLDIAFVIIFFHGVQLTLKFPQNKTE